MASLAMTFPLLPGKSGDWKRWVQEMAGAYLSEFQASRKRLGITREESFLQHTPQGDMAVFYIEAEDIAQVFQGLALSQDPFDVLFRQQTREFFGLDLAQPLSGPPPKQFLIGEGVDKEATLSMPPYMRHSILNLS